MTLSHNILRGIILLLVFGTIGCGSKTGEESPQMSRNMLRLRGYEINEKGFYRALRIGDRAVVNGFFHAGIDPDETYRKGYTPLTWGITNLNAKTLELIVMRADVNKRDKNGNSPLHYAILKRNAKAIEMLIEYEADVNLTGKTTYTDKQTPIFLAVLWNDEKLVRRLLKLGADPNIPDGDGDLPLTEVCLRRRVNKASVKLLVEGGAKVNVKEANGITPLMYAAGNSGTFEQYRREIVDYLLEKGADPKAKDNKGRTAADFAREAGDEELAKDLGRK